RTAQVAKGDVRAVEGNTPTAENDGITPPTDTNEGNVNNEGVDIESTNNETNIAPKDERVGRSLTAEEMSTLTAQMEANVEDAPVVELSEETWEQMFPGGKVATPMGEVTFGENQLLKLVLKNRQGEFGMLRPTLENPDVVIEEKSEAREDQETERPTSYLFVKTFKYGGKKIKYYMAVTVKRDGLEVDVSNHITGKRSITEKMQNGKILHLNEKYSSLGSDGHLAEHSTSVPDLLPTQEETSISSGGKDTTSSEEKQAQGGESSPLGALLKTKGDDRGGETAGHGGSLLGAILADHDDDGVAGSEARKKAIAGARGDLEATLKDFDKKIEKLRKEVEKPIVLTNTDAKGKRDAARDEIKRLNAKRAEYQAMLDELEALERDEAKAEEDKLVEAEAQAMARKVLGLDKGGEESQTEGGAGEESPSTDEQTVEQQSKREDEMEFPGGYEYLDDDVMRQLKDYDTPLDAFEAVALELKSGRYKITPESYDREMGSHLKTERKAQVGLIAKKGNGGLSINEIAKRIGENDDSGFLMRNGEYDDQEIKNIILDILRNYKNARGAFLSHRQELIRDYVAKAREHEDDLALEATGMTVGQNEAYPHEALENVKKQAEVFDPEAMDADRAHSERVEQRSREIVDEYLKEHPEAAEGRADLAGEGEGGRKNSVGETPSEVDEDKTGLGGLAVRLAEAFGHKVTHEGDFADANHRGYIEDGVLHINPNLKGSEQLAFVVGHELTHSVEGTEGYKKLAAFVQKSEALGDWLRQRGYESLDEAVQAEIKSRREYGKRLTTEQRESMGDTLELTAEEARQEVLADFLGEKVLSDPKFLRDMLASVEHSKGVIRRFLDALRRMLERLGVNGKGVKEMRAMADMMEAALNESERLKEGKDEVGNSIRSMRHDLQEGKMFNDLVEAGILSKKEAKNLRKELEALVDYMADPIRRSIVDMNETYDAEGRQFFPYKPNSDKLYKISMDFSTLCSKRILTQYVIEALETRLANSKALKLAKDGQEKGRVLSAEQQLAVRNLLMRYREEQSRISDELGEKMKGFQVACAMCYVESARLNLHYSYSARICA
ncbi:MAG: hypothetical protein LIP02_02010, partial [Bacteroidales bacterium]|nr:hypothetical protein [Bacteroidales bacterium]